MPFVNHDLVYANSPQSPETIDDDRFITILKQWGDPKDAVSGDGWSGSTLFERQVVIPWILRIFDM